MKLKHIILIVAIVGLAIGGYFVNNIYNMLFAPNTTFNNDKAFVLIPTNATFLDVKEQLTPLVKDIEAFEQVAQRKGYINAVKAGKYAIVKGMNNNAIVNTLRSGNIPVNVTFNNQDTLEKLAGRIQGQIEADSIMLVTAMYDSIFLEKNGFTKETALAMYVPNTYEFFWNTSGVEFRERMLKEYHRFWNEERVKEAEAVGLTPVEVMTMASIVQKETAKVSERKRVAGVYMNRLNTRGWLLEADPTVIYAFQKKINDFDFEIKRVLHKHINETETSLYNTYKHEGLPPGPIAMPDISSINAVLHYEKHEYYFFAADPENWGSHKFAKSLTQHNRNAAKYRAWANKNNL